MKKTFIIYSGIYLFFIILILTWPTGTFELIINYGHTFFLGLLGAIIANCTGAGGGVVFVPFFSATGFSDNQAVATSMAIQCFGMTAGAISWLKDIGANNVSYGMEIKLVKRMMVVTAFAGIVGMLLGQYTFPYPEIGVSEIFRGFSIVLGVVLFAYTFWARNAQLDYKSTLSIWSLLSIIIICVIGGVVTSWISVGIGEFLALLLFFLGFSPRLAVALSVVVSSISVLTGIVYHMLVTQSISFEVVLFAAPAALVGGYFARFVTAWLGNYYLKIFFAVWILLTGILMH